LEETGQAGEDSVLVDFGQYRAAGEGQAGGEEALGGAGDLASGGGEDWLQVHRLPQGAGLDVVFLQVEA